MKKHSCNIGDVFGDYVVIDNTQISRKGHTHVLVKCSCGEVYERNLGDLINGRISKCRKCTAKYRKIKVNIGDKFKNWTVIKEVRKNKKLLYECKCKCGSLINLTARDLIDPLNNFQCLKCAQEERGFKDTIKNGRVGDLTKTRYSKIKKSAEKRNIEFNLTISDLWEVFIIQNKKCAITGDVLNNINEASLDRIDSNKGYVKNNIQWVTIQANLSKHVMSTEELIKFCTKVLNYANQQPSTPLTKCEGSETNF